MFDISNYDIFYLYYFFILFIFLLYFLFKNKIYSILDPLFYHIIWIASIFSFLVAFILKHGVDPIWLFFLITMIFYVLFLFYFTMNIDTRIKKNQSRQLLISMNNSKFIFFYLLSLLLLIYSQKRMWNYFLTHELSEWVFYRFLELQGRDPLERILSIGARIINRFTTFYIIFILKKYRGILTLILLILTVFDILAGGRSALISLSFNFGSFMYFYINDFHLYIKKLRRISIVIIFISVFTSIIVSSMYGKDATILDGVYIIINRIIASADGLEYYLLSNGYEIDSGLIPYFLSIFGIYFKHIIDINHKNIGHQLSELMVGGELDFAQGSNYTLPLQVMVIGVNFATIYIFLVAFLTAKMRNLVPKSRSFSEHIIKYYFVSNSFLIATDPEYGFLVMLSFFLVYFTFFYPFTKFKFNLKLKNKNKYE